MNHIYVILGFPVWFFLKKRVGLWYVHREVTLLLRIATFLVNSIFSTTPAAYRVKTKKVFFVGHGIDVNSFVPKSSDRERGSRFKIAHIGRITGIKNLDVLISAFSKLNIKEKELYFYGEPVNENDKIYGQKLRSLTNSLRLVDSVFFEGSIKHDDVPGILQKVDCTVNLAPTGGMDKAVLESAAAKTPVFVSNASFDDFLGSLKGILNFDYRDSQSLSSKIMSFYNLDSDRKRQIGEKLRESSLDFDIGQLIFKIVSKL